MKGKYKITGYLAIVLGIAVYLFFFVKNNFLKPTTLNQIEASKEDDYIFSEWKGPKERSIVLDRQPTPWQKYHRPTSYSMGILLTDTIGRLSIKKMHKKIEINFSSNNA